MTSVKKVSYAIGVLAIPILLVAWLVSAWLLANKVPSRPKGVRTDAVFLWAPAAGFPGGLPRRGWWLSCWEGVGRDVCKLSDISGGTEYEGEFIRYSDRGTVSNRELQIDPKRTAENKVWVGGALVPLVYLHDGAILVPASAYDEAAHLLADSKARPSR